METTSKINLEQLGAARYNMLCSWFARKNYDDMFIFMIIFITETSLVRTIFVMMLRGMMMV